MSRLSIYPTVLGTLLVFSVGVILPAIPRSLAAPAATTAARSSDVKPLFCAFGSVEFISLSPPPGFESEFAVVVVEINSPSETRNVAVSNFVLFDEAGRTTKLKRVVKVEEFDESRIATEGEFAYYLNTKSVGTRRWNGTLPAGKIRLRIRVALIKAPIAPVRFRLTIGRYVIEGPVDGAWPT
jgi:hypothetical protein